MYIIVIGWIYVVLMMSVAEDTVVAGVMTFLLYGVLPVSILVYLGGSRRRRRRQRQKSTDSIVSAESAAASQEDGTDAPQVKPEVSEEEATPPHHPHPPS